MPNTYTKLNPRLDPMFYSNVYTYYIRGGYWCILVENILNILLTAMTLIFVTFVCFFLNWDLIAKCESEQTCSNIQSYVVSPIVFHPTIVNICMFLFIVLFFFYWLWISVVMIKEIFMFVKYKEYYEFELEIDFNTMQILQWNDVVAKISESPEVIVGSIMKRDNYLIALVGSNVFDIQPQFYTNVFLWLINVGILNQILIHKTNVEGIKKTMKTIGVIQFLVMPLTITLLLIHYIVSFTTDIYTSKTYSGPKEWTLYAKLMFREYNELSHIFNERLTKSHKYANKYEQKFNSNMINIIMDKLIFVFGTYLTFLVLMTLYDDRIVMYMKLFNRNLLWYVAIITSIISLAKLMIVYPTAIDESAEEIMSNIIVHTRYCPSHWIGKYGKYEVLAEFKNLYRYKIIMVLIEICSVVLIPFYMLFGLNNKIEKVVKFIVDNTAQDDELGSVCDLNCVNNVNARNIDKMNRSIMNFNNYYKTEFNISPSTIVNKLKTMNEIEIDETNIV